MGDTFTCPFCGSRFRKMLAGGSRESVWDQYNVVAGGWRENVYCPECYSTDKERLLMFYLSEVVRLPLSSARFSVLHIAPETHLGPFLAGLKNLTYVSGDINPGRAMVVLDITQLPLPDCSQDIVICSHVLEHVVRDEVALGEIYRVLRPGGFAILQVPFSSQLQEDLEDTTATSWEDRERVFGQGDHVRLYSLHEYRAKIEGAGFTVQEYYATSSPNSARYAVNPREPVFICSRES